MGTNLRSAAHEAYVEEKVAIFAALDSGRAMNSALRGDLASELTIALTEAIGAGCAPRLTTPSERRIEF